MTVEDISFLSIVTNDVVKFEHLFQFYVSLGFRLSRNYSKVSDNGAAGAVNNPKLHIGISNDSLRELWLESFPLQDVDSKGHLKPWQELTVYSGDNSTKLSKNTILKLRLTNLEDVRHAQYRLQFFTADFAKTKDILAKIETDIIKIDDHEIHLRDPVGNDITISRYESPLSKMSYESTEDYLKQKSEAILKSRKKADFEQTSSQHPKKKIAVMTSGGDAPGMNPAVRAVVRAGIYLGCDVYAVYEGYEGLVKGGDLLKKMEWGDVRSFLSQGGTNIGTARCKEMRERWGRVSAAYNMITNGIDALIVCGGDGSLTGADLLRSEWPSLLEELIETGKLTKEEVKPYEHLTIVGLVGSIDNDMSLTDATIGAYSALDRITEMVDLIDATAASHSRAFVIEVMGRHCGWLGLMSGISTGADFIFIPERPPKAGSWREDLKAVCSRHREKGRRKTTVIVSEGAIDDELNPITSEDVKKVLVELGLDTRITTLGHVQRGGTAVAYDRLLATLQGVDAVKAVLDSTPETPSPMIGVFENKIVRQPLMEAVKMTKAVATAIEERDFEKAMSLRDSSFEEAHHQFLAISTEDDGSKTLPKSQQLKIGIIHVGAPSAGLNVATRAAALYCLSRGHVPYAGYNGFHGIINDGIFKPLSWLDVEEWHNKGGSELGTNRSLPSEDFGKVAYYIQKYELNGLIIIGGFEAFTALNQLYQHKLNYPVFDMPMVVIPATVSNNVPGSEYSLGSDTCLNQLVNYCDAVKQSASSSRRRVFVVEVQGGHSGFVASYCGLITGSLATYTPESRINIRVLQEDIALLTTVFEHDHGQDRNGKMIIRNEQASSVYSSELIADIFKESANGKFETRTAVPGHVQQGFTPSSMDRVNAAKFAVKTVQYIEKLCNGEGGYISGLIKESCNGQAVIGVQGSQLLFTHIHDLYENETDVKLRKGKKIHWDYMTSVSEMLSGKLLLRKEAKEDGLAL
jgi:6-phosphofructokinase 1